MAAALIPFPLCPTELRGATVLERLETVTAWAQQGIASPKYCQVVLCKVLAEADRYDPDVLRAGLAAIQAIEEARLKSPAGAGAWASRLLRVRSGAKSSSG